MEKLAKSPWLLHYDASSCNGCDIEVLACTTPVYDIERFGIINTGDPFQADILLITGGVNSQSESVVKQIYQQMPNPKVVVAVGICACTGGVFKDCLLYTSHSERHRVGSTGALSAESSASHRSESATRLISRTAASPPGRSTGRMEPTR